MSDDKKMTLGEGLIVVPIVVILLVAVVMVLIAFVVNLYPLLDWWADLVRIDWTFND